MHHADRAVLRIGTGIRARQLGSVTAWPCRRPHLGVIMAWVVLCRPGEPLALKKGLVGGLLLLGIMISGVLLVPPADPPCPGRRCCWVALSLYLLMQLGDGRQGGAAMLLIMAIAVILVAGLEQRLAIAIAQMMMAVGILVGTLVNPDGARPLPPLPAAGVQPDRPPPPEHPERLALRAVGHRIAGVAAGPSATRRSTSPRVCRGGVALAQQSTSSMPGRLDRNWCSLPWPGALLAFALWMGLSLWPTPCWMLVLMLVLMTLGWRGGVCAPGGQPLPALVLEQRLDHGLDSCSGPPSRTAPPADVWLAAAMRCGLYLLVAGCGWFCIFAARTVVAGSAAHWQSQS